MRILSIGRDFQSSKVETCSFKSSLSALDFDAVIWEPVQTLAEYNRHPVNGWYMGSPALSDNDSVRFVADTSRRNDELTHMTSLGRPIIIFTPPPAEVYVHTGEVRTSGTGRNAQRTRIVNDMQVVAASPLPLTTVEATGSNLEVRGSDAFRRFYEKNADILYYRAVVRSQIDQPVFYVTGTDRVVGGVHRIGTGLVLLLPALHIPATYSVQRRGALERRFIDSLLDLLEELGRSHADVELPQWTEQYLLPGEPQLLEAIGRLNRRQEITAQRIRETSTQLESLRQYKAIMTSSGAVLEELVGKVFEELGCTVEAGPPGRDDLIIRFRDRVAVAEVKGVGKSAAEKHAAQLEKWVSEYFAAHGVQPKGILIVNAHRDLPLEQRTENAFPPQMRGYSERREHCLLTSLQLLCLLLDVKAGGVAAETAVEQLFANIGVYELYQQWDQFLARAAAGPS